MVVMALPISRSDRLQDYATRHYTLDEIERLADVGGVALRLML
jgi:hypothetical protein